jgi:hypothetical protein
MKNVLTYKGFIGSVNYSADDRLVKRALKREIQDL